MRCPWLHAVFLAIALSLCTGCLPELPQNVKLPGPPRRTIVKEVPEGRIQTEDGVADSLWLEVDRPNGAGPLGGYFSENDSTKKALVILLHGASTFSPTGEIGSALLIQKTLGLLLQQNGYLTWALTYPECGTPYGQDDLQAVVDAIDWLDRVGKSALGVQQVYVAGYSTGGTLTILANRKRTLDAAASISGLTEPSSIEAWWDIYRALTGFYPLNLGACQMKDTIEFYGPPDDPRWDALDSVEHINEFLSPMILLQGTADQLFSIRNERDLEVRYNAVRDEGGFLPEMQFVYLDHVDHFVDIGSADVVTPIVDFFDAHLISP